MSAASLLDSLAQVDPAPLFALSLLPYLLFLWWSWRSGRMPRQALWGFGLTLLFVLVTIAAALLAEGVYGRQLADVPKRSSPSATYWCCSGSAGPPPPPGR
jgi:hypothetical protein